MARFVDNRRGPRIRISATIDRFQFESSLRKDPVFSGPYRQMECVLYTCVLRQNTLAETPTCTYKHVTYLHLCVRVCMCECVHIYTSIRKCQIDEEYLGRSTYLLFLLLHENSDLVIHYRNSGLRSASAKNLGRSSRLIFFSFPRDFRNRLLKRRAFNVEVKSMGISVGRDFNKIKMLPLFSSFADKR